MLLQKVQVKQLSFLLIINVVVFYILILVVFEPHFIVVFNCVLCYVSTWHSYVSEVVDR